jgi:hypothetical protein
MSEIIESRRVRWLLATVVLATVVLTGSAQATTADVVPPPTRAVNIAIGASTSASTAAADSPASNAVDGSAGTAWCATQWTGSVMVDLARPRTLSGLGVTLGSTASPATVSIDLAVTPGSWHPVPAARSIASAGNTPSYHGAGLFYWEPEWAPGVGWEPGAGSPNDNLTLFDFQGRALPSIGLFENPVLVCQRYDRSDVPCVLPS